MKLKLLIQTTLLLLSGFLFAAELSGTNKLNLENAIECALENNNSIRLEKIALNQTNRDYSHSWNNFLPSVSATGSAKKNGELSSSTQNTVVSTEISGSISFSAGLASKLSAIKKNYQNGQLSYEEALRDVKASVIKSFYSILYMQKQVELNEELLKTSQEQYEQTKIKKSRGMVPELELLQSQLNAETAKTDLKNAEKNYYNSLLTFLNDIGYIPSGDGKIELEGSLEVRINLFFVRILLLSLNPFY